MYKFNYITPERYFKEQGSRDPVSLKELQRRAENDATCDHCPNPVWKLVDLGMCFSCVTGESDASDDYELKVEDGSDEKGN